MSSVLPPGPLHGHYVLKNQLYTVHSGSSDIILNTPTPLEAPNVADDWLDLEHCLRVLGMEMFRLAPNRRLLQRINPWFFPARFKFLHKYRTEQAARFAAWRSMENFLPLLGYVTMGLWCMHSWEADVMAHGEEPPDWQAQIANNTNLHPSFVDLVEKSVNWDDERVGALYRIEDPAQWVPEERERRAQMEWILTSILHSTCPIPIYLCWGSLLREINMLNVSEPFQEFAPDVKELEFLTLPEGQMRFS
ncbi:hypothetical protein B0H19DRAFT_1069819 [Mycena capillaripes]|nr:hypothetical protein B0H19DRAFT_1069819 [Mycena capillaripes]